MASGQSSTRRLRRHRRDWRPAIAALKAEMAKGDLMPHHQKANLSMREECRPLAPQTTACTTSCCCIDHCMSCTICRACATNCRAR